MTLGEGFRKSPLTFASQHIQSFGNACPASVSDQAQEIPRPHNTKNTRTSTVQYGPIRNDEAHRRRDRTEKTIGAHPHANRLLPSNVLIKP